MFGLEIHCLSISYWKPGWARWKCTGKCRDSTNASKVMTREKSRISRSRLGTSSNNSPPASGMNVTSVRIALSSVNCLPNSAHRTHPDHVGDYHRRSRSHPAGVRANISRLHVANCVGNVPRIVRTIVEGCVNHVVVDPVPENAGRAVDQRLYEQDCVQLIHVIFICDGVVEAAQGLSNLLRQLWPAVIEQPG